MRINRLKWKIVSIEFTSIKVPTEDKLQPKPGNLSNIPSEQVDIFVKTPPLGITITMTFDRADSIDNIRQAISLRVSLPVDQIEIIHAGRQLEDDRTLADYNLDKVACGDISVSYRFKETKEMGFFATPRVGNNGINNHSSQLGRCFTRFALSFFRIFTSAPTSSKRLSTEEEDQFKSQFLEHYIPGCRGGHWQVKRSKTSNIDSQVMNKDFCKANIIAYANYKPDSATAKALTRMGIDFNDAPSLIQPQ